MKPTGLPIEQTIPAVRLALRDRGAGVLVAPPGAGKTTVVPLRLLDEPWRGDGRILVLEPRRLATRAAARRMAALLGEPVGETVGYVTRTDRARSAATRVEVVTEGVLTRRLQRDPDLPGVAAVLFDEFHERNLHTDLGLALAYDARRTLRPDLRMLVMSATIDADRVAALLGDDDAAPVIVSEGRLHPVDVRWTPPPRKGRLEDHVAVTVRRAVAEEHGNILVFLPGMREIVRVRELLGGLGAEVAALHGSLPAEEQDAALRSPASGTRKVILSTDIAETSLTVEGVRIVVDSGLARSPSLDLRHGMTRLATGPISKASADQRAGRAGRVEPGIVYRLWSTLEHAARRPHIEPEILRVDLAPLALELAVWGTDPAELRFLDPPPTKRLREGGRLLEALGAVDADGRPTTRGRAMASMPAHPRLARMIHDAGPDGAVACAIAAVVEDRDLLRGRIDERPVDLAIRVRHVLDPSQRHPLAVGGRVRAVRDAASDLARRAGVAWRGGDVDACGRLLALAFPDRLAIRRGGPGRFQLRTGTTAWMPEHDPLAVERFVVAADLDGKRKHARVRLAAAIDAADVAALFADDLTTRTTVEWIGDRLMERTERRLGGVILDQRDRRPDPSPAVAAALTKRLVHNDLRELPWTMKASSLRARVTMLHHRVGDPWPDWSIPALARTAGSWLEPALLGCTGLDDVNRLDLLRILRGQLGHAGARDVDRLLPVKVELPSGRRVAVDYTGDVPTVSGRVQDFYGATEGPTLAGEPALLVLLSPADRPVQITQDLGGFWAGSWSEVRKEMAGRYPKHRWPERPADASPGR